MTLRLRPFDAADLAFVAALARDERVTRFVGDGRPWSAEQIVDRSRPALRRDPTDEVGAARWFVAVEAAGEDDEEEGREVGLFVTTRREHSVEVGYWVAPPRWGRGVAGAMLDQALEAVPGLYGPLPLSARVAPDNAASVRALTRRSFEPQGHHEGLDHYVRGARDARDGSTAPRGSSSSGGARR